MKMEISKDILDKYPSEYEKAKSIYGLSYKQFCFANAYISSNNALQSARISGYKGTDKQLASRGYKLINNDKVKSYLAYKRNILEHKNSNINDKKTIFGMEQVKEKYIELINTCDNPSVVRAALSDLTKIYGGFSSEKIDINANVNYADILNSARLRLKSGQEVVTVENEIPLKLDTISTC